jgi:hypothetical protein
VGSWVAVVLQAGEGEVEEGRPAGDLHGASARERGEPSGWLGAVDLVAHRAALAWRSWVEVVAS